MSGVAGSRRRDVVPALGAPNAVAFDGVTRVFWWGKDDADHDCIATRAGRLLTWPTEAACRQAAQDAGWRLDVDQTGELASNPILDLQPAQDWVSRRCLWLDPDAGLNLWNWAWDVAYSTGQPWNDRGRIQQRCYDKLVAANIPFVVDVDSYRPTWTSQEVTALRAILATAIHTCRVRL